MSIVDKESRIDRAYRQAGNREWLLMTGNGPGKKINQ